MKQQCLFLVILVVSPFLSFESHAENHYQVTLLRAAPGSLQDLIDQTKAHKKQRKGNVSIMRHSQGDHWDLMLLEPVENNTFVSLNLGLVADFQHEFIVTSQTAWKEIKPLADSSGTFHIEMFHAVHGKSQELIKQRNMENKYLTSTKRRANVIFETTFGSDVDSFTLGYYKDLMAFASMPDLPAEVFSKAATDAGFKSRDDIGLYLRELILSHHDTLATRVD
jgi:hypothetical protein